MVKNQITKGTSQQQNQREGGRQGRQGEGSRREGESSTQQTTGTLVPNPQFLDIRIFDPLKYEKILPPWLFFGFF